MVVKCEMLLSVGCFLLDSSANKNQVIICQLWKLGDVNNTQKVGERDYSNIVSPQALTSDIH